ncbi:uncharacterized protein [Glycine max]|uniref:uncharacterized protein n=1 Tax=Glycine max TaxID=3847 RepID=UPI000E21BBE4|nr:uncharacterized protein LOC113001866 [Glycine max]|eukprot:XP_025984520.1 uncharacterized protein LOC113001866 [Glycine max]
MKTGQKIFELLDSFVEEIGEKNVIQVVTDNGSNYVLAVGYYLNPKFFYTNPNIDSDNEVVDDLYKCIDKLSEDDDFVVEVHKQLLVYKRARERFGMTAAMKARTEISPAEWWKLYGGKTPHLQTIAIKVLSLTCSSSGCERNWSTFEHIHSKKRSRLEHQKLQDLVYVKYNQALLDRFECHDVIDPIALNDINDNNEWLLGELEGEEAGNDLVFDDDDLNWLDVAEATGAGEPLQNTRSQTHINKAVAALAPTNEKGKKVDGTRLYGKYKEILLVVVAQDDNNKILPIVFAIIKGETTEA